MAANDGKIVSGSPQNTTYGSPGVEAVIDPTYGSLRASLRPTEYIESSVVGGHYQAGQVTGALTVVAAAGAIFSARWSPGNGAPAFMILKRLQLGYTITTAFTAGQTVDFDVVRCTSFTAADTGGAAIVLTGNNNKNRSNLMATSAMTDLRIATTGALGAGTKTQDVNPFGYLTSSPINLAVPTATAPGGNMQLSDLYKEDSLNQHPQMFGNNEGYNVRVVTTMGAAGVIKAYIVATWAEVPGL